MTWKDNECIPHSGAIDIETICSSFYTYSHGNMPTRLDISDRWNMQWHLHSKKKNATHDFQRFNSQWNIEMEQGNAASIDFFRSNNFRILSGTIFMERRIYIWKLHAFFYSPEKQDFFLIFQRLDKSL
jgi:hypothetical protein